MLIPFKLESKKIIHDEVEELTFKDLSLTEADLEEFIRRNVDLVFSDDEALLVVGQQSTNVVRARADLVAVDGEGSLVLIEIKRDQADIEARKEPFEFQAIRYAASYATLREPKHVVEKLFAPYIEKHKDEFQLGDLTASELAARKLDQFLRDNNAGPTFNRHQRIVLVASGFDEQTLSACAWMSQNGLDVTCATVTPLRYAKQYFLQVDRVIPPPDLSEYFIELRSGSATSTTSPGAGQATRAKLPNLRKMMDEWKLVSAGDEVTVVDHTDRKAELIDWKRVEADGKSRTLYDWALEVTGWQGVNVYDRVQHVPTGKTLDQLRRAKLQELEKAASADT